MIVYLWAEASRSPRRAEAGAIFRGQSVKRDFHEKSTFFSLLLSSVRKTQITCSPESVGGVPYDGGPCRAKEKTTFLHVSPVIYLFFHPFIVYSFPVSSAKAFAVFILFSLPARDILFYLVSSPILCYDFFLWFQGLRYLQTWQKDPLWNVFCIILWFEQEVEWCHWQGRIVLCDIKLKLVLFLCFNCIVSLGVVHDIQTSITRAEKHSCTDTWWPLGLGDYILNIHYIVAMFLHAIIWMCFFNGGSSVSKPGFMFDSFPWIPSNCVL